MEAVKILLFLCATSFCNCDALRKVGIYGGHQITIRQAPFVAQVRLNKNFICGGSIINDRFILTAAFCVEKFNVWKNNIDILVGTDIRNDGSSGHLYELENFSIHPNHTYSNNEFDVCLIKVSEPIVFGDTIRFIGLADNTDELPAGTIFQVTGWGKTKMERNSHELLQASTSMVSNEQCQLDYAEEKTIEITSNMICAGGDGSGACYGDGGGPLTREDVQVGVVSHLRGDCSKSPMVYTKVSSVHDWIQETIQDL